MRLLRLVIIMTALATVPAAGQDAAPRQTFRSAADLVTIQASVRDGRGRLVSGLTARDFEVRDNGESRPVLSLRSDRQSPLTVAILLDTSGSMRVGSKVGMAEQAYDAVLAQLQSEHDEAALFTFDTALHERRPFTRDLATLRGALADVEPFGATSLYDAVAAVARRLGDRSGTHKAIVVLTDGLDTASAMSAREVSGLASSIDVPVYVVATVQLIDQRLETEGGRRAAPSASADLRDLSEWTGGRFVFATTFGETVSTAATLIGELRQQYVLAIEAAAGREWRRLEVRVRHPSAVVKARSGYYGG